MFTYGSVCSGIEAATCAWHDFASPLWFSEIEPFPCAVLAHHYPDVPNAGDMTLLPEKILNGEIPAPDVLVGGTPCQAFSIAGHRRSLDDDRGSLTLTLIHILEAIDYVRNKNGQQPCLLVWENVPGVLSAKDNAFGHFLAGLAQECQPLQPAGKRWTNAGYVHSARTVGWRILNAQHFGLAQRRKRVFLAASARERSVAQILFEQKGLRGDFEASQGQGQDPVANVGTGSQTSSYFARVRSDQFLATDIASTQTAHNAKDVHDIVIVHGTQDPITNQTKANCLGRNGGMENVIFEIKGSESLRTQKNLISPTLKARMGTGGNNVPRITLNQAEIIRKLTPIECERLQGFPDDWTKIPYRGKPAQDCPDSLRYKAIGNSMAVPVMRWIGRRVDTYLGETR